MQNKKVDKIIATAKKFEGTKYKRGGIDEQGMDCSGLVYTSFLKNDIKLPRTSLAQSALGQSIPYNNISTGDLLFFKTLNSNRINHVGIVISKTRKNINFIHASFEGVITSSIKEPYWEKAFVTGKRIVNPPTHPSNNLQLYKVKSGDTLYGIAKKHHTSIQSIKELNHLTSDNIAIGMILKIL
ncbi:C40 family peptidase [Wenyingzhuangia sp. IMCC45467]